MIGFAIAAGVICLLACVPIGVALEYNEDGGFAWLKLGFVRIVLYPKKKKVTQTSKKKTTAKSTSQKEKNGGSISEFLPIMKIILDFLSDFRRKLWVQNLEMKLTLADADPSDLAVNYGRAWGVLGNVLPLLEQYVKIKNRNLEVQCDFTATDTLIEAKADIIISFGNFLMIAMRHGFHGFKEYFKITKKTKAV